MPRVDNTCFVKNSDEAIVLVKCFNMHEIAFSTLEQVFPHLPYSKEVIAVHLIVPTVVAQLFHSFLQRLVYPSTSKRYPEAQPAN